MHRTRIARLVRASRSWAALVLLAPASSCMIRVGCGAENFPAARSPAGISVVLSLPSEHTVSGELLALQDTAFLVLRPAASEEPAPRIVLVPFRLVHRARFRQTVIPFVDGRFSSPEELSDARSLSRYPQGVNAALLDALLQAYRQPQLEVRAR